MKDFQLPIKKLQKLSKVFRKKLQNLFLKQFGIVSPFLLPAILFLVAVTLRQLSINLWVQVQKEDSKRLPFPISKPASYPAVYSDTKLKGLETGSIGLSQQMKNDLFSSISAYAFIVMDSDSKAVIFAKNENFRFSMASTTKIMTALTGFDHFALNDVLTVKQDIIEGAKVGFKRNDKVTFEDLLYGMLLPSGNDAALTIAQNYPDGEGAFVEKMNQKALYWHLYNTHFGDSAGLMDDEDYTTVSDLAQLASLAMKNTEFAKIVRSKTKTIKTIQGEVYHVSNLNKLLGEKGVIGVKTGFTDEAGQVLVTATKKENHTYIIVVMKSDDRFLDTEKLLSFIQNHVVQIEFSQEQPYVRLENSDAFKEKAFQ